MSNMANSNNTILDDVFDYINKNANNCNKCNNVKPIPLISVQLLCPFCGNVTHSHSSADVVDLVNEWNGDDYET